MVGLACEQCGTLWEGPEAEDPVRCPNGHEVSFLASRARALLPGVRNPAAWRAFEDEFLRREPLGHEGALALLDALWAQAKQMGAWPPADPLEGIETDIFVARAVNRVRAPP